jgi:hypothetical protein
VNVAFTAERTEMVIWGLVGVDAATVGTGFRVVGDGRGTGGWRDRVKPSTYADATLGVLEILPINEMMAVVTGVPKR